MMEKISYYDLDKYFTLPKKKRFYKRVSRKLKKRLIKITKKHRVYTTLNKENINIFLWEILEFTNNDYKRFLIKKVIENEQKRNNIIW